MAESKTIVVPSFDFLDSFYYPSIIRNLTQFQRTFVPEITSERDEEPFQQLLRAYALVGHLNNVLLDITANESFLPTARLLESIRGHLKLIDVRLDQATPAQTDMILELARAFDLAIPNFVPINSQFGTKGTAENPQIIYENNDQLDLTRTDQPTAIFVFRPAQIEVTDNGLEAGDGFELLTVQFREGIEYSVGATIPDTITNMANAINNSANVNIQGLVYAVTDGISKVYIMRLDSTLISIPITEIDNAVDHLNVIAGGFSGNKQGLASLDATLFDLFGSTPRIGDEVYIGHSEAMFDTLEFVMDTPASGLTLVTEFFDGVLEDGNPDSVTNLGSNLEFDLTEILGTEDRSNTIVRIVFSDTGANELAVTVYEGGKNLVRSAGLLGQSSVDTTATSYVIGTFWNPVKNAVDETSNLEADGKLTYSLPQTSTENWLKTTVNGVTGFFLRMRVAAISSPTDASVDRIRIDTGKQFLLVPVVQGQTVLGDVPLGSTTGGANQQLNLSQKPLIENTLIVEVDEGDGYQPYNVKENNLTSTSKSKDVILEVDAEDVATLTFGDGDKGKIPAAGIDNVRAIYRIGADRDGNVGANTIVQNVSGITSVNRVYNPRGASGYSVKEGSTEEDKARLKIEGPASLRVLRYAIALPDWELLATQYTTSSGAKIVSRAKAIEETFGPKTIELIVVGPGGRYLTEDERLELQEYFNGSLANGVDPNQIANTEVTVVNYTRTVIDVVASVEGGGVAEEFANAVKALLNPDAKFDDGVTNRWEFGQEIPISVINNTIFEVAPEVVKKVTITTPVADVTQTSRALPFAGDVNITVVGL